MNKVKRNSNCEILENKLCNLFFRVLWTQAIQALKTDFTENFFLEIMSTIHQLPVIFCNLSVATMGQRWHIHARNSRWICEKL